MRAMQHFDGWMKTARVLGLEDIEALDGFIAAKILPRLRFRRTREQSTLFLKMLEKMRGDEGLEIPMDKMLDDLKARAESDETNVVRYFGLA